MATINERVIPLDELDDFEVAEGDPDVRGWHVYARDGMRVGEVDELLVDTEALKVRYLDVELTPAEDSREERHVLIPVGYARLHELDDHILIDALDSGAVGSLPAYPQEPLTREFESALLRHFNPQSSSTTMSDPYAGEVYDDERFYGSRRGRTTG